MKKSAIAMLLEEINAVTKEEVEKALGGLPRIIDSYIRLGEVDDFARRTYALLDAKWERLDVFENALQNMQMGSACADDTCGTVIEVRRLRLDVDMLSEVFQHHVRRYFCTQEETTLLEHAVTLDCYGVAYLVETPVCEEEFVTEDDVEAKEEQVRACGRPHTIH